MEETQSYFSEFEIRKMELINFLEIEAKNISFNFYLDCIEISNATIYKFDFKYFDLYKLSFVNCIFECSIFNSKDIILDIQNNIFIHKCIFKNRVDINDVTFRGKLDITLCIFETKCCFYMNAFFEFCNFKDNVFNDVRFEKNRFLNDVMFYNSDFNMFNFSQSIFKGSLNVVNTNLNFTFGNLQEKIKQEYEDFNKTKEEQDKKPLCKFANDFRDSFRTFKNALIKDNNFLEASNFHKYELYCKELELKNKKDKTLKDRIDKWQLVFYRKLCDHHTDLLLNLRWFVVVVGFFVSVLFVLRYGDGNLLQFFNKDNDLLKILKDMLNIKALNDSNVTYLILLYSFIGLFFVRTFFIFYYLVIFILMLTISPYNLFSVVNFVVKGKLNSFLENIIMVAYALIMILVLFSLQKTARKNSIVPS
ncbi:hypothetical protein EWF11_03425 [Campylobacter coli]|nr:hypothetical protein [Campylobacter coli]